MKYKRLCDEFYRKARESGKKVYEALAEAMQLYLEAQEAEASAPDQLDQGLGEGFDMATDAKSRLLTESMEMQLDEIKSAQNEIVKTMQFNPDLTPLDHQAACNFSRIYNARLNVLRCASQMRRPYDPKALQIYRQVVDLSILEPKVRKIYTEWLKVSKT
jgi:hypothetical protein